MKDELLTIPGVDKSISKDLEDIGIYKVSDLKDKGPEEMYLSSNMAKGFVQDKCLLYTFRCAVYFASHKEHDPHLLKWWNWKGKLLSL